MSKGLLEDLLFFLERPSVTGAEKELCDDLEARISASPGWEIRAHLQQPRRAAQGA